MWKNVLSGGKNVLRAPTVKFGAAAVFLEDKLILDVPKGESITVRAFEDTVIIDA